MHGLCHAVIHDAGLFKGHRARDVEARGATLRFHQLRAGHHRL